MRRRGTTFRVAWPREDCRRCAQPLAAGDLATYDRDGQPVHADCDYPRGTDE